jgi:two-component system sensor histidine kinase VicK
LELEGNFLVVHVSDNGIGIPQQEQIHVFDRFFRASNVVDRFKGAGLGLSIVKSIVDKHNGRIWLDSREGVGSTFFIMLPTQDDHSENEV